jgi:hypothetical protein
MEVRSEQGMVPGSGREPFPMAMQNNPVQSQSTLQSMRLTYAPDGTAIYKPIASPSQTPPFQPSTGSGSGATPLSGGTAAPSSGGGNGTSSHGLNISMGGEVIKKKRGRPRKYGPDGAMSLGSVQQSGSGQAGVEGFSPLASGAGKPISSAPPDGMKKRGRPLGSTNKKQQIASPLGKLFVCISACGCMRAYIHWCSWFCICMCQNSLSFYNILLLFGLNMHSADIASLWFFMSPRNLAPIEFFIGILSFLMK